MLINSNLRKTGDSDRRFETSSCKFYLPVSNNMVANWQIFFFFYLRWVWNASIRSRKMSRRLSAKNEVQTRTPCWVEPMVSSG